MADIFPPMTLGNWPRVWSQHETLLTNPFYFCNLWYFWVKLDIKREKRVDFAPLGTDWMVKNGHYNGIKWKREVKNNEICCTWIVHNKPESKKGPFRFHVDLKFVSNGLCFVHLLQTCSFPRIFNDTVDLV